MGGQRPLGGVSEGPLRPESVTGVTSAENPQTRAKAWRRWTPADDEFVLAHPEMSGRALARALGRTHGAVRNRRWQLGRFSGALKCEYCHERPVWAESAKARRMRMCHGCFNAEMSQRAKEAVEDNRRRQREFKARHGGKRNKKK